MNINEKALIDIRRGDERFRTRTDWLDSRHSFSFGQQYDPNNVGHGQVRKEKSRLFDGRI